MKKISLYSMEDRSEPNFRLNLRLSGLPFRLTIVSILGVGATAILLRHPPNLFAMLMVMLSVTIIVLVAYAGYSGVKDLKVGEGLVISWFVSMLVPVSVYLLLPWIEANTHQAIALPFDREITRVYLWILGLFVLPIVLGMEQLIYAQTEVETLEKESEVSDLDFRIRPHFLFNSLNSVASLIAVDQHRAEDGLMDLADMFRIILTDKRKLVPFSAEYEIAYKYMNLEKMRLGDRLKDEWQVDDIDDTVLLPMLTLQPILENAIYHGIETRLEGGKVTIKAHQSNQNLYITVINPKPDAVKPARQGNKIAQQNLVNRFKYLYHGKGSINYVETDSYYIVTIKVPRVITVDYE